MRRHTVIAFKEILDDQLPIGGRGIAAGVRNPRISKTVIVENCAHVAKGRVKIVRFAFAHVDENQAMENADVAREQTVFGFVEILRH